MVNELHYLVKDGNVEEHDDVIVILLSYYRTPNLAVSGDNKILPKCEIALNKIRDSLKTPEIQNESQ